MPVRLEPGRTYVLWLNSEQYQLFRDRAGNPAMPLRWVFSPAAPLRTMPAPGARSALPLAIDRSLTGVRGWEISRYTFVQLGTSTHPAKTTAARIS